MDGKATYSLEQCIDDIGMGKFQWCLVVVLGLCVMTDAVELMLLTILGPALKCSWPDVSDFQIASLTTCAFIGMTCGALLFGVLADKYGRRRVILIGASLSTLFSVSTAFALNYYGVLVARMFDGLSVAGSSQSTTLLVEYAPSTKRSSLYALYQVFWVIGSIYVYVTAMLVMPYYGWRPLAILSALPALIVALSVYFVPESPRYYMASGEHEKAKRVLEQVALTNKRALPPGKLVDTEAKDECGSMKQLFHAKFRKTTFLLGYMWIAASFGFYGIVFIYTSLLTSKNESTLSATNSNATISTACQILAPHDYISLVFTAFGDLGGVLLLYFFVPRFNRRTISIINYSAGSLCFSLFLVAPSNEPRAVTVITFLTRTFFNSQFIFMYLYTAEVYPTVIRAVAVGCGMALSRVGAMVAPYAGQLLIKRTFYGTMIIFILTTAIAVLCSCLVQIETKGQALRQTVEDAIVPSTTSGYETGSVSMAPANDNRSLLNEDNGAVSRRYDSLTDGKSDAVTTP